MWMLIEAQSIARVFSHLWLPARKCPFLLQMVPRILSHKDSSTLSDRDWIFARREAKSPRRPQTLSTAATTTTPMKANQLSFQACRQEPTTTQSISLSSNSSTIMAKTHQVATWHKIESNFPVYSSSRKQAYLATELTTAMLASLLQGIASALSKPLETRKKSRLISRKERWMASWSRVACLIMIMI